MGITWLTTARDVATAIAVFLFLGLVSGLITSNVRVLAADKGWDQIFLTLWRRIEAHPRALAVLRMAADLRNRWWFWLSLGLSAGLALALWILPISPSHESASISPAPQSSSDQTADAAADVRKLEHERFITIGRTTFFNLQNELSSLPPEFKAPPNHFVIVSPASESSKLAEDLNALFYLVWAQSRGSMRGLNLPNYDRDLDAPKFEGKGLPGITVHGRAAIADFIAQKLNNCFQIRRTGEMPSGVAEYYNKIHPTTISISDVFVWLEIGKGSPWKGRPCTGPGS